MEDKIIGEAGAGLVRIIYTSLGVPIRVEIDDEIFTKDDKGFISDLFVAAMNDGYKKLKERLNDQIYNLKNLAYSSKDNNLI